MFSNFVVCVLAVLPLMILLAIGALVRKADLLSIEEVHRMNHMVFVVFFPVLMFDNLYSAAKGDDLSEVLDPHLVIFAVVLILSVFFLSIPIVNRIDPLPANRGVMIQGIYRSNFILMGLPLSINILGEGNVASTAVLIVIIVPLYNVLAVCILEYARGGKASAADLIRRILTNPLIMGAVTAALFLVMKWQLPAFMEKLISDMSRATTPIALILLGASFNYRSVSRDKRNLMVVLIARLLIVPAIGIGTAVALGFTGAKLVAVLAMTASPAAVSSYTMAESMGGNGELAGNIVIFSTPISCATLFGWLFLLKSLALI